MDWFWFRAVASSPYTISTFDLGQDITSPHVNILVDTVLTLFDMGGTVVLATDDDGGTPPASRIDWVDPADGIYFVRVSSFAGRSAGAYQIGVTELSE